MANVDIEGDGLVEGVKCLAIRHYGDSSEASISRVVESALEMRLLSIILVEGGGNDIEEPVASWEFASERPAKQLPTEIRSWLFRGGNE
jgi:hypothetical protein